MNGFAWVTLATNDSYCLGALVLAHSLKRVETKHDIAVLITPGVTSTMREKLSSVFNLVKEVNILDSQDEANLALLARPELGVTFTKLHCWNLTQYEKCVFVDADTLVIRNCDELFDREELSAAPDVGWPDCFNSGVFVFRPSQQTFASLTAFGTSTGSFDGGDQGLLNLFFSDWSHKDISKHLPFIYNMCSTASYSYLPAYKHFGGDVKIIHFIGNSKPWLQFFDTQTGQVHPTSELGHLQPLLQHWWDIFCESVHPQLSSAMISTVDTDYREASSILALREHNFFPSESSNPSLPNTSHHVCHTSTDETYDEVDVPNFSEFKDPWNNYIEPENCNGNNNHNVADDYDDINNVNQNNNHNFSRNYQVQYCLFENSNNLNKTFNHFKYNDCNNKFDNLSNDNCNLINQTNFELNEFNEDSIKLTKHLSEHLFLTIEGSQLQDRDCSEEYSENSNYQESRITQLNNKNSRSEEKYLTNYTNNNKDEKIDETNVINDYHDILLIKSLEQTQLKKNKSSFQELSMSSTDNLKCVEIIKKCNQILLSTSSHPQSCTKTLNIASQSEMNTDKTNSNCAGIAGALARITLREASTPEQVIYEDYIRKQSWEQGQIDYMGRDSFDNIWKKICTTLLAPPEEESQPKETISPKSEQKEIPLKPLADMSISTTEDESATEPKLQDNVMEFHSRETDKKINEGIDIDNVITDNEELKQSPERQIQETILSSTLTSSPIPSKINEKQGEQILALTSLPPQLCIKEFGESAKKQTTESSMLKDASRTENKPTTIIPLSFPSMTESNIPADGEKFNITCSPVPLQMAEPVLETDIKESLLEDIKPVREEAVSTASAPIHESISAAVETPFEPATVLSQSLNAPQSQPNGSTSHADSSSIKNIETTQALISSKSTTASLTEPTLFPISESTSTTELEKKIGVTKNDDLSETLKTSGAHDIQSEISSKTDNQLITKVPELVPQKSTNTTFKSEQSEPEKFKSEHPASKTSEQTTETAEEPNVPTTLKKNISVCLSKSALSESAKSEELKIPATPTITEATPPTSPSLDVGSSSIEELKPIKKITKKVIKKECEDKPEISELEEGKKGTKKVVKKVIKKPKEILEEGTSSAVGDKPKKVIKATKKTVKIPESTSEYGISTPNTSASTISEAPVPPKRKAKVAATKSAKKSES